MIVTSLSMSSPCELITVWCHCGAVYSDSWRASMNLSLDDFDNAYIDQMSSTTCPSCGLKTPLGTLLARFEEEGISLVAGPTPEARPVTLYRERSLSAQPRAHRWIKEWTASQGQNGIEKLVQLIDSTRNPNAPAWPPRDSLCEVVIEWMISNR